jgi:hypothetical protein
MQFLSAALSIATRVNILFLFQLLCKNNLHGAIQIFFSNVLLYITIDMILYSCLFYSYLVY